DSVGEGIVDGLVPAHLQSAGPRALDERFGRGDHEEQIDDVPESREQVAPCLVRIGGEAVETEAIDQQMRHVSVLSFASHVSVELVIDDLQFVSREGAAIFVVRSQIAVIEELLAPDIWTDDREVAPIDADIARERSLQ